MVILSRSDRKRIAILAIVTLIVLAVIVGRDYVSRRETFNKSSAVSVGQSNGVYSTPIARAYDVKTTTTTTLAPPVQVSSVRVSRSNKVVETYKRQLERCKDHILASADFRGVHCEGIAEDSPELTGVFAEVFERMALCVENEISTGVTCTYGTSTQQLNAYTRLEQLNQ